MKKGENDPYIVLSVAKIFWKEKKLDKAKKWYFLILRLERALALDPNIGDTWAFYWAYTKQNEGDSAADLVK